MKSRIASLTAIILLLTFGAAATAKDLGAVQIPTAVKLRGTLVQPGSYTFSVEKSGDKLMIALKQNGATVAGELAITKPAGRHHETARILYQPLKQDGGKNPMSRIYCSYQGTLYLLYFEKP